MAGVNPQMVVRIVANIEQLKKALAEGTSAVTTTTAGFSKLANSLDGSRLIQQGHNITAVVNRLGDATKLTDAEAKRLRDTLDKVIDKAQRMGTEIPPDILRTRDALVRTNAEVDKMPSKMSGLVSSLKSVAGAMGVAFSVGAVVGFGKEIFRMGDQITLMADKTGMSSTEVQRLGFVADQSSVSMESIVGAVQNLQQRLGDGDTGAVGAIKALGTNTSNFLALGPYEQFLRLAEGIGSIEDPTRKATLEAELFGRAWKEIGPAVTSQIRAIANEAPVMSDNTRKALDAAGDAWSKFTLQLKVWVAELYNVMGRSFDRLVANLYKGIAETIDGFAKLASLAEKVPFADRLGLKGMSGYFDEQARWYRDAAKGLTTYTDEGKKAAAVVTALASNTKHAEVAGRAHTKTLRLSESAAYSAADANKKLNEMMREQIALLPRVKQGVESMGVGTSGPLVAQMATLGRSPLISPVVTALKRDMEALNRTTDMGAVAAHQFIQSWDKLQKIDAVTKASNGIGELSSALSNLAQVSGGAFGGIVSGLASVVAAIDSAQKAKEAFSAGKAAGGLEGFVGMASGILGMASAAIAAGQALKGMWDAAFGSKGRDLVKDFAGTVGGFDALRAQLATLGPEGEKLWIALTQGVGRNNPKQAQDAIDA
ncbi:MAG TPA: hypothetical protein VNJ03_14935, partial [Vicinamibacterales bacterium]|nr:hypothetical protein [Vicinamibacterales bacterium]